MIIARGKLPDSEDQILVIGLTIENMQRMSEGDPVLVTHQKHGLVVPLGLQILAMLGESDGQLTRWFVQAGIVNSDTDIRVGDPKDRH